MTKSSLKGRFAPLGAIRGIDRKNSDSSATLLLRKGAKRLRTIAATVTLVEHGMSMLRAHQAIEGLLARGLSVLEVSKVVSVPKLIAELAATGIDARQIRGQLSASRVLERLKSFRVRADLTQQEFSLIYNIDLRTLQNWEQGHRTPDLAALNYLILIVSDPDATARALYKAVLDDAG